MLNDGRLARLFSKESRHCALQLWVLQVRSKGSIEDRVVYGRLLPYNHSNDSWSATDDDAFSTLGSFQAQIVRLNLYIKSNQCAELLRQLSAGRTISAISEGLKLNISHEFKARFGTTALPGNGLVYRPVAYLLNRDAHDRRSPSSPHGGAGAFSASITQTDKAALFRLDQDYDVALTESVVKHLNADTGLDFGGTDTARLGDIELLVFPTLDDQERHLLRVNWSDASLALVARFNAMQVPHFKSFQFRLSVANSHQIFYSCVATADCNAEGIFEYKFELGDKLRAMTDSCELEIFGFPDAHSGEGTLCCRWGIGFIREIHVQGHLVGRGPGPVKFDWLEKATRPSTSERTKAALTIDRGNLGFTNRIGGREADPWVPPNRDVITLFSRLHPPKSDGQFFPRWGQGDGEGRLQFVEWFKALLAKYQQHQVVIFDPYFETAGLALVLLCAASTADYIVFTSLPKPSKDGETTTDASDKPSSGRLNNLVASCEQNAELLKSIKFRIYGLKEGRLHDRYILIMGSDGLPVAGFNLSNSFQKAAENFPLLVTPIPPDVLLKVEQYKSGLVQETKSIRPEGEVENLPMRLLFDSAASPAAPRRYEPLSFLEMARAGDVLSLWSGEASLRGLSGDPLKERMAALSLIKDTSLALSETVGLRNWLGQKATDFADLTSTWNVLGEVLAHSHNEDPHFRDFESKRDYMEFMARFLEASFNRTHEMVDKELAVTDPRRFREPVEALLHSPYSPHHFFYPSKYAALTWSEFFAIKILWLHAPDALLAIAESQMTRVPVEPQGSDVMRLSLLSQIVSEIALSVQLDLSLIQRNRLVASGNGLLRWLGLNAIERQLETPEGRAATLQLIASFPYPEQVRALGWMVHRAAGLSEKVDIFNGLVTALHGALPRTIPADELRHLVDSMRGHMKQLAWAEPWLFQDVISPLLRDGRANADDACEIWIRELAALLEPQLKTQPRLFNVEREGQTTNIAAYLFAHSSPERRQVSVKLLQPILKRQKRIVQQPLGSTADWTRWDSALVVSMWILAFTRWGQHYLRELGVTDHGLDELSRESHELAMVRPIAEWRSDGAGKPGQLAAFLDQAEELDQSAIS